MVRRRSVEEIEAEIVIETEVREVDREIDTETVIDQVVSDDRLQDHPAKIH